jgi:transglutaminase-like putative cysteine protease
MTIPAGDAGTAATLGLMAQLARAGAVTPIVRQVAVAVASGAAVRDGILQADTLRNWIEDHSVFIRDPQGTELLHDPALMVRSILTSGVIHVDCDDIAILAAALGVAVGLRARFVVVGFRDPRAPFRHVWAELQDPRGGPWRELDITRPAQGLSGLAVARRAVWAV